MSLVETKDPVIMVTNLDDRITPTIIKKLFSKCVRGSVGMVAYM
jgi:hypothetical protein